VVRAQPSRKFLPELVEELLVYFPGNALDSDWSGTAKESSKDFPERPLSQSRVRIVLAVRNLSCFDPHLFEHVFDSDEPRGRVTLLWLAKLLFGFAFSDLCPLKLTDSRENLISRVQSQAG